MRSITFHLEARGQLGKPNREYNIGRTVYLSGFYHIVNNLCIILGQVLDLMILTTFLVSQEILAIIFALWASKLLYLKVCTDYFKLGNDKNVVVRLF